MNTEQSSVCARLKEKKKKLFLHREFLHAYQSTDGTCGFNHFNCGHHTRNDFFRVDSYTKTSIVAFPTVLFANRDVAISFTVPITRVNDYNSSSNVHTVHGNIIVIAKYMCRNMLSTRKKIYSYLFVLQWLVDLKLSFSCRIYNRFIQARLSAGV